MHDFTIKTQIVATLVINNNYRKGSCLEFKASYFTFFQTMLEAVLQLLRCPQTFLKDGNFSGNWKMIALIPTLLLNITDDTHNLWSPKNS